MIDLIEYKTDKMRVAVKQLYFTNPEVFESDDFPCGFDYGSDDCDDCEYEVCLNEVHIRNHLVRVK